MKHGFWPQLSMKSEFTQQRSKDAGSLLPLKQLQHPWQELQQLRVSMSVKQSQSLLIISNTHSNTT